MVYFIETRARCRGVHAAGNTLTILTEERGAERCAGGEKPLLCCLIFSFPGGSFLRVEESGPSLMGVSIIFVVFLPYVDMG